MAADERATVKTYVPASQKERWTEHAAKLDMSQSEFVRTMVQAGRRDFDIPSPTSVDEESGDTPIETNGEYRDHVLTQLAQNGSLAWEDLVEAVVSGIEDELESVTTELQTENVIRYSGRDEGYVLVEHETV